MLNPLDLLLQKAQTALQNSTAEIKLEAAAPEIQLDCGPVPASTLVVSTLRKTFRANPTNTNSGDGWFNLQSTPLTQAVKDQLHLIKKRGALDPKRHYKKIAMASSSKQGGFFQLGSIVGEKRDRKSVV